MDGGLRMWIAIVLMTAAAVCGVGAVMSLTHGIVWALAMLAFAVTGLAVAEERR